MNYLKVGDIVEMYNDKTTSVSGRVSEVRSAYEKFYGQTPEVRVVYSIKVEGLWDELKDYEWELVSVNGEAA